MKNLLSVFMGIVLGISISACAAKLIVPRLENRTLYIHKTGKLFYRYCKQKNFWRTKCVKWVEDFYDLTQQDVRDKLKGFTCRKQEKPF